MCTDKQRLAVPTYLEFKVVSVQALPACHPSFVRLRVIQLVLHASTRQGASSFHVRPAAWEDQQNEYVRSPLAALLDTDSGIMLTRRYRPVRGRVRRLSTSDQQPGKINRMSMQGASSFHVRPAAWEDQQNEYVRSPLAALLDTDSGIMLTRRYRPVRGRVRRLSTSDQQPGKINRMSMSFTKGNIDEQKWEIPLLKGCNPVNVRNSHRYNHRDTRGNGKQELTFALGPTVKESAKVSAMRVEAMREFMRMPGSPLALPHYWASDVQNFYNQAATLRPEGMAGFYCVSGLRLLGREIMQGDMHRGRETAPGLGGRPRAVPRRFLESNPDLAARSVEVNRYPPQRTDCNCEAKLRASFSKERNGGISWKYNFSMAPEKLEITANGVYFTSYFECGTYIDVFKTIRSSAVSKGREKREIPEKTHRPAASIPTCENPGSDPAGNKTRFALVGGCSSLETTLPRPPRNVARKDVFATRADGDRARPTTTEGECGCTGRQAGSRGPAREINRRLGSRHKQSRLAAGPESDLASRRHVEKGSPRGGKTTPSTFPTTILARCAPTSQLAGRQIPVPAEQPPFPYPPLTCPQFYQVGPRRKIDVASLWFHSGHTCTRLIFGYGKRVLRVRALQIVTRRFLFDVKIWNYFPPFVAHSARCMSLTVPVKTYPGRSGDFFPKVDFKSALLIAVYCKKCANLSPRHMNLAATVRPAKMAGGQEGAMLRGPGRARLRGVEGAHSTHCSGARNFSWWGLATVAKISAVRITKVVNEQLAFSLLPTFRPWIKQSLARSHGYNGLRTAWCSLSSHTMYAAITLTRTLCGNKDIETLCD
ncbi:hypothetical protein PR048_028169 [Dryococelus australis]|uniref:Uncharacterized protein n=1 Tax=Dryococelus australis TaxID=614101 RepID=A0ABQ9GII3_9NEOP|nr:hypothetical protein PR048_028169 [Dryococelus australis]